MRFAPYLFCLGLAALAPFACSSTTTTATAVVRPQLVAVDPADFLGAVPCVAPPDDDSVDADTDVDCGAKSDPSAAQSYVATLFDVTPAADGGVPDPGTPLASSPPTSCRIPVTFAFVVAGHRYLAEVDAYREDRRCLTPISAGSRLQSDANGARAVAPWVATCGGYPPSPVVEAGTESAGAGGADDDAVRPPGVVSYAAITQTPHDCGVGLCALRGQSSASAPLCPAP
ncbi:MAG: hypothetical protein WDO69_24830 [Pseudomonadota bacterium]